MEDKINGKTVVAIVVALHLIFCSSSHVIRGQGFMKTSITEDGIQGRPAQASDAMARRGLMQFPAISRTHFAFVCANQIWIVSRDGSAAPVQLTNVPGTKTRLAFSPDGQTLAFSATLHSNPNLYTLPITGGTPTRITYLPFNVYLCQWTQRNELLFYTDSLSFNFLAMQLFTVNSNGGGTCQAACTLRLGSSSQSEWRLAGLYTLLAPNKSSSDTQALSWRYRSGYLAF